MNKLTKLERLQQEASDEKILTVKKALPARLKGLYYAADDVTPLIAITDSHLSENEEVCILAEELGHYHTSAGDLLSSKTNKTIVNKQELQAKRFAMKKLIPIYSIIKAYEAGIRSAHELADFLEITEEFLRSTIENMKKVYGLTLTVDETYTIIFEPFGIYKRLDDGI